MTLQLEDTDDYQQLTRRAEHQGQMCDSGVYQQGLAFLVVHRNVKKKQRHNPSPLLWRLYCLNLLFKCFLAFLISQFHKFKKHLHFICSLAH